MGGRPALASRPPAGNNPMGALILRTSWAHFVVFWVGVSALPALCCAQNEFNPKKHHRWARFDVGAWSRLREVAETFDEKSKLIGTSVTETTATLKSVDKESVTLLTNVTVEIAGRKFDSQPELVPKNFYGADNGNEVKVEEVGGGTVTIGDERIACRIRRVTVNGDSEKRVTTIYFNDAVAPYELRRETVSTDVENKTVNYETNVEVVAVNLPYKVLTEIDTVSFVKTEYTSPKKKTTTLEVYCPRVPGGLVAHWSTESDDTGQVVHRSVLQLADYGLAPVDEEPGQTGGAILPRRTGRIGSKPSSGIKRP